MVLGMYTRRHQSRTRLRQTYELKEHCGAGCPTVSFRQRLYAALSLLSRGRCLHPGCRDLAAACSSGRSRCQKECHAHLRRDADVAPLGPLLVQQRLECVVVTALCVPWRLQSYVNLLLADMARTLHNCSQFARFLPATAAESPWIEHPDLYQMQCHTSVKLLIQSVPGRAASAPGRTASWTTSGPGRPWTTRSGA